MVEVCGVWWWGSQTGISWRGRQDGSSVTGVTYKVSERYHECIRWPVACPDIAFYYINGSNCWYRHSKIMTKLCWPSTCLVSLKHFKFHWQWQKGMKNASTCLHWPNTITKSIKCQKHHRIHRNMEKSTEIFSAGLTQFKIAAAMQYNVLVLPGNGTRKQIQHRFQIWMSEAKRSDCISTVFPNY